MKENVKIESWVDSLPTKAKKTNWRRTRKLWKTSPAGVLLIAVAAILGGAVLGGFYFSTLQLNFSGSIHTNGNQIVSVFTWDGTQLTSQTTDLPCDIQSINAGDTFDEIHHLKNMDNGNWLVTFDPSAMSAIFNDPNNPFYGFGFQTTPSQFILIPGQEQAIDFQYSLSHEFLDPVLFGYNETNSMPFHCSMNIIQLIQPVCVNDSLTISYLQTVTLDPTLNDEVTEGLNLTITGVSGVPSGLIVTQNGNILHIQNVYGGGSAITLSFHYTVTDGYSPSATGTISVYCPV